ncbi:helix-turn-helix domain-containing protein [Rhodococcus pyridinivorans]|uniref:helix-turn-helix domain-containing protein n=1 Tax=Rhodococcus pyridinivorans TaxID=103816 RepID=UPI001930EA85|nr:leucine zipper domain-containing protein [Rhodococcus pyridinivorans]
MKGRPQVTTRARAARPAQAGGPAARRGSRRNVSATCRYYGISRQCYYTWRRRFDEEGFDGLEDRSSVPHHRPTKTDPEISRRSSGCGSSTTSGRRRSRCIRSGTTTSRSARPESGGSSTSSASAGCPRRNATNARRRGGSATRSNVLVTSCRST